MARGTTTTPGKTRTAPVAQVVGDKIDNSRGKGKVTKHGPQTSREAQDLSGKHGRSAGSVRQIGPTEIRPSNSPTGKVTVVGEGNFEDVQARRGGFLDIPYARQSGSVRQVGPSDRGFDRATEGTGGVGQFRSGRLPRSNTLITGTPLLISGAGRAYDFGKSVGEPGTFGPAAVKQGGAGGSLTIAGRRRKTPPAQAPLPQIVTPTGPQIVVGSLGDFDYRAPTFANVADSAVTDTTVTLAADVDPQGLDTTAWIEWGEDTNYDNVEPDVEILADDGESPVIVDLTGLTAATDYHWRVVAENSIGLTVGDDATFTTDA